jgi:threonine/homoserine/homoserine lactone efflux protein
LEAVSLLFGIVVGLAAGLSPGPLVTLVISETLKNGRKEGIEVAISPLISELPIVLFVLVILSSVPENSIIIAAISLLGASFLIYLGFSNLRCSVRVSEDALGRNNALLRGIVTNLLNPTTYVFWFTVGGPRILEGVRVHFSAAILFVLGFYAMLVGSETAVAIVMDKSKTLVSSKYYVYIIRALGVVLILFALTFVKEALELLNIL